MPKLNINLPKDYIMPLLAKASIEYVSLLDSVRSPYLEEKNGSYFLSERLDTQTTSCFGHWQLPLTLSYTYTAAKYGLKACAGGGVTNAEAATFLTKNPGRVQELCQDFVCKHILSLTCSFVTWYHYQWKQIF